jgi:hypothetical protein
MFNTRENIYSAVAGAAFGSSLVALYNYYKVYKIENYREAKTRIKVGDQFLQYTVMCLLTCSIMKCISKA